MQRYDLQYLDVSCFGRRVLATLRLFPLVELWLDYRHRLQLVRTREAGIL